MKGKTSTEIILTVQSNGSGGRRLGICKDDSKNYFKCRKVKVILIFPEIDPIECYTACGNPCDKNQEWIKINPETNKPYGKKGYDLNKKELSHWLSGNFKNIIKGKPNKLKFIMTKQEDVFTLTFDKRIL